MIMSNSNISKIHLSYICRIIFANKHTHHCIYRELQASNAMKTFIKP